MFDWLHVPWGPCATNGEMLFGAILWFAAGALIATYVALRLYQTRNQN
jgi:hypothetical protein